MRAVVAALLRSSALLVKYASIAPWERSIRLLVSLVPSDFPRKQSFQIRPVSHAHQESTVLLSIIQDSHPLAATSAKTATLHMDPESHSVGVWGALVLLAFLKHLQTIAYAAK